MNIHKQFCVVPLPNLVYVGPATRDEFDRLALEVTVHGWERATSLDAIYNDGQQRERRVTSKVIEANGVTVIFQWLEERVIDSEDGGTVTEPMGCAV